MSEDNFQYLLRRYPSDPLYPEVKKIRGSYVHTTEGRRFFDLTSGYSACVSIGGSNLKVRSAIKRQMKKYSYVSAVSWSNSRAAELAELLVRKAPCGLDRVMFPGCSGSEAIEAAMRMSYQVRFEQGETDRTIFITRSNAYHGITSLALSLTSTPVYGFLKPLQPTNHVSIPQHNFFEQALEGETQETYARRSAQQLEDQIVSTGPERITAFVAESMLGSLQGNVPPSPKYWKYVREICDRYDIHIILDEVYCGLGRSGKVYCCEWDGITPDFVAQGKQLAAGYGPISAVVTKSKFEEIIKAGQNRIFYATTYEAHPLAVVAAIEVQKIVQSEELLSHVNFVGEMIQNRLNEGLGKHEFFKNVRGRGALVSIEYLCDNQEKFNERLQAEMRDRHGVLIGSRFHRTNFNPPSNTASRQVERAVEQYVALFKKISLDFSRTSD